MWISNYGFIEKGHHIHHKDGDKSNNSLENLESLPASLHLIRHMTEERKKESSARMHDLVRPKADLWHGSPEGIEWHKKHGSESWIARRTICKNCFYCGKRFETKTHHQKFCSNACKSGWRRKSKKDHVIKNCEKCNVRFSGEKHLKTRFCSRKCGSGRRKSKVD